MKKNPDKQIHIHYMSVFCGYFILVVYDTASDPERQVKFLVNRPTAYLGHTEASGEPMEPDTLAGQKVAWVDEEDFLKDGVKVQLDLSDDTRRMLLVWCHKHRVKVEAFLHGFSCFMCNPANTDVILEYMEQCVEEWKKEGKHDEFD